MNVLFLTLIDFRTLDEHNIYADLLREFIKNGHQVSVISPMERKQQKKTYMVNEQSCNILKLQIGNIQKTNIIEKGISTLLIESQFVHGIKKYFPQIKFDLVLYSTPPITLLQAVQYVKQRDGAYTYLLLKDIFPQNAVDMGMLQKSGLKGFVYKIFRNKEVSLYKNSDYIGCMSEANVKYILDNNGFVSVDKIGVCPNSIEPLEVVRSEEKRIAIRNKYKIPLDDTVFVYGGNLGKPQGIDFLIKCLQDNNIPKTFFVLIGNGTEYEKMERVISEKQIKNVLLMRGVPKEEYDDLVCTCDVGLIFLDRRFKIPNFPSRILSYMQAELPVLAATDKNTDIGEVIREGGFGDWCISEDSSAFLKMVKAMVDDAKSRKQMGIRARKCLEEKYHVKDSYKIIIRDMQEGLSR